MKIDKHVETKTELKKVTLTLTPRETFLLTIVFGNFGIEKLKKHVNELSFVHNPPFLIDKELTGYISSKESEDLMQEFYYKLQNIFNYKL